MGIVERSDVALGLVQHQVDLLLALHRLVVEPHFVGRQHLGPQFGDNFAVDRNDARRDEIVGLAARADARLGDEAVQAHLARLLLGIEFRIRRRFVVVFLIGRFERFVDELPVAEFLIPEFFLAELLLAVGLVAELLGSEFLLAVGRLIAVTAARTLLVAAVTVTVVAGFVAEGTPRTVVVLTLTVAIRTRLIVVLTLTVAIGTRAVVIRTARAVALPAGFVAVVRLLEDRTVVGREMGVIRSPAFGPVFKGGLLRIGGITLQTRATLDTLRRSHYGALAFVASEAFEHRGRVVFRIFHFLFSTNNIVAGKDSAERERCRIIGALPDRSLSRRASVRPQR